MKTKTSDSSPVKSVVNQSTCNRLLGVYPQRQEELFMQRIKIPGGRINWTQWRKIAELADKYTHGFPLHLTTRQDIELHNLSIEDIPSIHDALAEVALTTFGAGGDSLRNITICSACDLCKDSFDLLPLAQLVQQQLEQRPVILNLPRKFKISFSGCERACAKPWLSDLGFIARQNGMFNVIGAGSLGAKPKLGMLLYENFPASDILPHSVATIEFFNQYGNRVNRRQARLRHVREKLGDQIFKEKVHANFTKAKAHQCWPVLLPASSNNKKINHLYRLQLPNGNITPQEAFVLADNGEHTCAILRINLEHGLEIYGEQTFQLPESLASFVGNPVIVACPGSTTCSRALVDCWATADKIRKKLSSRNITNVRINISGCPNNCAQSTVADIGLIGILRNIEGQQKHCYRVFTGGGNGKNNKSAKLLDVVQEKDISGAIKKLL